MTTSQDSGGLSPAKAAKQALFPMITGRSHVPWIWVFLLACPTTVNAFLEAISGVALTFTMKKFVSDPALITFLGSINIAFNFLVAPWAAWKSDHIWTRFGRRRPFILIGWGILFVTLIAVPLAPTLSILVACIVVYQFCADFGYTGPWNPLYYEMIPSHQRGRAVVVKRLGTIVARLVFNLFLIGQFDHIYNMDWSFGLLAGTDFTVTGEALIYATGGGAVMLVFLQMLFMVREKKPAILPDRQRFSPLNYVKVLFGEKQWRLLFLLVFCSLALTAGLGQLGPLLITEQFGYTKQIFGQITAVNMALEIAVVLPISLLIIDRFDRFRIFQTCLILSTLQPLCFWLFIKYAAPGGIPEPWQIVAFNAWNALADVSAALALEPLIFDYVPRNMMGTINSGFLFVRGALSLLVLNGVGLWVKFFSEWFHSGKNYDYSSGYLYVFLIGVLGIVATAIFEHYRRSGALVMYGKLEEQQASAAGQ